MSDATEATLRMIRESELSHDDKRRLCDIVVLLSTPAQQMTSHQLEKARVLAGRSIEDVARRLQVDPLDVAKWEAGRGQPGLLSCVRLNRCYGVGPVLIRQEPMVAYYGLCEDRSVFFESEDVDPGQLDPRHDLVNHSPDGFEWGYGGSGPAQLALALLAHHHELRLAFHRSDTISAEMARDRTLAWYQRFKAEVVVHLDGDWRLTSWEIADCLDWIEGGEEGVGQ